MRDTHRHVGEDEGRRGTGRKKVTRGMLRNPGVEVERVPKISEVSACPLGVVRLFLMCAVVLLLHVQTLVVCFFAVVVLCER